MAEVAKTGDKEAKKKETFKFTTDEQNPYLNLTGTQNLYKNHPCVNANTTHTVVFKRLQILLSADWWIK